MATTRRSYTEEYRASAVEFVIKEGRPIVEVANNLGIKPQTLGKWVQKAKEQNPEREEPLSADEREELRKAREEIRHLKMQLEFAKKVATWFANEKQ